MYGTINPFLFSAMLLFSGSSLADWRQSDSAEEKLQNLVRAVPGTSHWMIEMGERYKNLYWAAKLAKWEFAQYQVEEMESLVEQVQLTRPKRTATAQQFLEDAIPQMERAVASREWPVFESGFKALRAACMHCHTQNDHPFIVLPEQPATASSPVLNLPSAMR